MESVRAEWMTVVECGKLFRRHPKTVHVYIGRGLLRATQMVPGGRVLISRKSVEDLLNRRMNRPTKRE